MMQGRQQVSRGIQLALCVTALAWSAAAAAIAGRGANGFAVRLGWPPLGPVLQSGFLLFLLVIGLRMLDFVATRGQYDREALALPRRRGWGQEWEAGAAVGWGVCLLTVLPLLLSGHLHTEMGWQPHWVARLAAVALALAALLLGTLAQEVIFRGYAFQRLIAAVGAGWATVLMSLGFALYLVGTAAPANLTAAIIDGALLGGLLTMAWLRTRALWVGWGLNFSYRAVAAVVLGLPVAGRLGFGSLVDTYPSGPRWVSGGAFGLDAALLTAPVLLAGMAVLYRVTRDYAWHYTFAPVLPGGYEVAIAPPAAHAAMERAAAAPPPLVQIVTPAAPPPIAVRADVERGSSDS